MARPSPRRAAAPLAPPARQDRAPARSAGRLFGRLSQPRQGDQDHPHRGRAQAGADEDFKLTDVQADAILNMRLRNLRRLEEMEIRSEDKDLRAERKSCRSCCASEKQQWKTIADEISDGARQTSGRRRRSASAARSFRRRRSTTRRRSRRPWSSASRSRSWCRRRAGSARCSGHVADLSGIAFKTDDGLAACVLRRDHVEILVLGDQRPLLYPRGRQAAGRPRPWRAGPAVHRPGAGGRSGDGVPPPSAAASSLSQASEGRGFVVPEDECLANTRKGKQVLNVNLPDEACAICAVDGDHGRGDRRKPQAAGRSRSTRSRKWRAVAAYGCSATSDGGLVRHQDLPRRRRLDLDRFAPAGCSRCR